MTLQDQIEDLRAEIAWLKGEDVRSQQQSAFLQNTLGLTPSQALVLLILYRAGNDVLSAEIIERRLPCRDGERTCLNIVQVHLSRIRKRLGKNAIENAYDRGWRLSRHAWKVVRQIIEQDAQAYA